MPSLRVPDLIATPGPVRRAAEFASTAASRLPADRNRAWPYCSGVPQARAKYSRSQNRKYAHAGIRSAYG